MPSVTRALVRHGREDRVMSVSNGQPLATAARYGQLGALHAALLSTAGLRRVVTLFLLERTRSLRFAL